MLDWVEAFAAHDASGDYGGFAPLLQRDGLDTAAAETFRQAAHMERVTNTAGASSRLTPVLGKLSSLGGAASLFSAQLQQRLQWVRHKSRGEREIALYEAYLARRDFLRAAIFLQEAAISSQCRRQGLDISIHTDREQARQELKSVSLPFCNLNDLRNLLAHGTVGGESARARRATQAAERPESLDAYLRQLRSELGQEQSLS